MLAYALPADFCDDAFDISETTAQLCPDEFAIAMITCFGAEYLCAPTAEDLVRIEKQFRGVGFPGCIGAVDCAGWTWKNCPKALQGSFVGKDGKPTMRLEAICDLDLWCWHLQFGFPGAMNDINILNASEHFNDFLAGAFPSTIPSYTIAGQTFNWYYYLADEIYPRWKMFIRPVQGVKTSLEKKFNEVQEGVRKYVERIFGVLFRQQKFLFVATELWSPAKMENIAKCCVILHNMCVEARREGYSGDGARGLSFFFEDEESDLT